MTLFAQAWHVKLKQRNVLQSTVQQILKHIKNQTDDWQSCSEKWTTINCDESNYKFLYNNK